MKNQSLIKKHLPPHDILLSMDHIPFPTKKIEGPIYSDSIHSLRDFLMTQTQPSMTPLNKPLFRYVTERIGSHSSNDLQPDNLLDDFIHAWHTADVPIPVSEILQELSISQPTFDKIFTQDNIDDFVFAIKTANTNAGTLSGYIKDAAHRLTSPKVLLLSQKDIQTIDTTVVTILDYIHTILSQAESSQSPVHMYTQLQALLLQTLTNQYGNKKLTIIEQYTLVHILFSLQFIKHTEQSAPISDQIAHLFEYKEALGGHYAIAKSIQAEIGSIKPIFINELRAWGNPQKENWQKWFTHIQNKEKQPVKTRDF